MKRSGKSLGFVGATGVAASFFDGDSIAYSLDRRFDLIPATCTIVNAGSVGGPKDDDPLPSHVVVDEEAAFLHLG